MDFDGKILELQTKINIETKIREGAVALRAKLKERNAIQQSEQHLQDSDLRIALLFTTMREIQILRFAELGVPIQEEYQVVINLLAASPESANVRDSKLLKGRDSTYSFLSSIGSRGSSRFSIRDLLGIKPKSQSSTSLSSLAAEGSLTRVKSELNLPISNFGYLRNDTAYTQDKVRYRLQQASVRTVYERKVMETNLKVIELMGLDDLSPIDYSARLKPLSKTVSECKSKLLLLDLSRKRYESINTPSDSKSAVAKFVEPTGSNMGYAINLNDNSVDALDTNDVPDFSRLTIEPNPSNKKIPMSGKFKCKILSATGLPGKKSSKTNVYVTVAFDGAIKMKSRNSSNGTWNDDISILLENTLEVQISVFENDNDANLLGLVWFQLSDLWEEVKMRSTNDLDIVVDQTIPQNTSERRNSLPDPSDIPNGDFKLFSLDLVPAGQVNISIKFSPEEKRSNTKLVRTTGVTKSLIKEGHRFVPARPMPALKCVLCLVTMYGGISSFCYRCQLCSYFCHAKCHNNPNMPRCVAKIDNDSTDTSQSPTGPVSLHEYVTVSKLLATYCNHCGILIMSLKAHKKCTNCPINAHMECVYAIPDRCTHDSDRSIDGRNAFGVIKSNSRESNTSKTSSANASGASNGLAQDDDDIPIANFSRTLVKSGQPRTFTIEDFSFLAVLGKGNFGKVMLARDKLTNKHFAIKILKKEFILENDEVESTRSEKRCFQVATKNRHPFLVNLYSCFQTESRLYFVMEYVCGGDLMFHIQHGRFVPTQAKQYACEVLLALEYWHNHNIVYRDLKLDNILITIDGHIKIADYGLCKENMKYNSTTSTFCGTPEFMAPELLLEKPYGRAVDWWAFGVLLYEMLLGKAPFAGDTEERIFNAILKDTPVFPVGLPKEAVDIMTRLLTKEPSKRLGGSKAGAKDIKKHAFFDGISWKDVYEKKLVPSFVPRVSGITDLSNFDSEFTSETPVLTPCHSMLTQADQKEFMGFTYVSDLASESMRALATG